jgi:aldose 1-epimerase
MALADRQGLASDAVVEPGDARAPLAPGELVGIGNTHLRAQIAPVAGGRIAGLRWRGQEWLHGYSSSNASTIGWGCYPMLPWAGRLRGGAFDFNDQSVELPRNFDAHAIHGFAFAMPWKLLQLLPGCVMLGLQLPRDRRWPFGGQARQWIRIDGDSLLLELEVTAEEFAMPAVIGWHPWLLKPDSLLFVPERYYPRDAEGIATLPLQPAPPPPWDDCFPHSGVVTVERSGQRLQIESSCDHWVIYDGHPRATCVEPQTGPPDAFNLMPQRCRLPAGAGLRAWMRWTWTQA